MQQYLTCVHFQNTFYIAVYYQKQCLFQNKSCHEISRQINKTLQTIKIESNLKS